MFYKKKLALIISCLFLYCFAFSQNQLMTLQCKSFDKEIIVDSSFVEKIYLIDDYAQKNNIKVLVQQSFRNVGEKIENAVVVPYIRSNHFVGHAIDINLEYGDVWYNSTRLRIYNELPEAIKGFLQYCMSNNIRWGGIFAIPDVVHFDDNFNENNSKLYDFLFMKYQKIYIMNY
jgi:hypothetical protein